jgi:hypothetical protein
MKSIVIKYVTSALCAAGLTLILPFSAACQTIKGPLEGVWSWNFTMPDGATVRPQLELKLAHGAVSGVTRLRAGTEAPITNAVLDGNRLKFEVIRQQGEQVVTTRYEGVVNDGRITGRIESNWSGEWQSYPWNATHLTRDIEGRWVWGMRAVELKLDGQKLVGKVILEGNAEFPLLSGSYSNGIVTFHIERERDGQPYINIFEATLEGRSLKGQITRIWGTETNRNDWEAFRPR